MRRVQVITRRKRYVVVVTLSVLSVLIMFYLNSNPNINVFDSDVVRLTPVNNGVFVSDELDTSRLAADGAVFLECKGSAYCQSGKILRVMATTAALNPSSSNSMGVITGVQGALQDLNYDTVGLGMGDVLHAMAFSKSSVYVRERAIRQLMAALSSGSTLCMEHKSWLNKLIGTTFPSVEAWICHVSALGGMARILHGSTVEDHAAKWFKRLNSLLRTGSRNLVAEMRRGQVSNMNSSAASFCREVSYTYATLAYSTSFCAERSLHNEVRRLCHPYFDDQYKKATEVEGAVAKLLRPLNTQSSSEYNPCAIHLQVDDGHQPTESSVTSVLREELNATIGPYARFMTERSVRNVEVFGGLYKAFTETEHAIAGDDWIWTDDNAKVLEMLVLPGVYETAQPIADKVLKFILKMIKSDFMLRRAAGPTTDANIEGFKVDNGECLNQRFHNGLMNYNGTPDSLSQSYRFHDGRDKDVVTHRAPEVHIWLRESSVALTFNLAKAYQECIFRPVVNKSRIETGFAGTMSHQGVDIATFKYLIVLSSKDTATDHQVIITPVPNGPQFKAKVRMTVDVVHNVRLERIVANRNGKIEESKIIFNTGRKVDTFVGKAPAWHATLMIGSAGFAYSSFRFISTPQFYLKTVYETRKSEIASVSTWYECETGVECHVAERHLITAGGLYDQMERYIGIMEGVSVGENVGMIDFSISYDIGAELNGLASFYLFATQNAYNTQLDLNVTEIKEAIDHHLNIYWQIFCKENSENIIPNLFLRGLTFSALAVNTMFAATGDISYLRQLELAMNIMFTPRNVALYNGPTQVKAFLFRCFQDTEWTSVDCQASAHLLFGRLLATFPFGLSKNPSLQICQIAEAAIKSGSPVFIPQQQEHGPHYSLLRSSHANFQWGFQGGLLMRGMHAVRAGRERYPNACPYNTWSTLKERTLWTDLEAAIYNYTEDSTTHHEGGRLREIRTSKGSRETNTESQPWITMGHHGRVVEHLYRVAISHAVHHMKPLERQILV